MTHNEIRNSPQRFQALASYSVDKLDALLREFESEWENYLEKYTLSGKKNRKYAARATEQLPTHAEKLFFYSVLSEKPPYARGTGFYLWPHAR